MRVSKSLILVVAMLAVAAFAHASNMGFKITIALDDSGAMDQQWFSLPYHNEYAVASDIKNDIGATICNRVYSWDVDNDVYIFYESPRLGTDFAIMPGIAYMVTLVASGNWVVVGSHDPGFTVNISDLGAFDRNWVSVPYHSMAADAAGLKTEIGATIVNRVYHWLSATDAYEFYESPRLGVNFPLVPGDGIMLTVLTSGTWTPSHY
jgi:hypothetical protein